MQRTQKKVHKAEVEAEKRAVIYSDTQKLLVIQREGSFTYRCVDCLHKPGVCIKSTVVPCLVHGQNAEELELGPKGKHALLCLLSPFYLGSFLSVGKSKTVYRAKNTIPGLKADDVCMGCIAPCCLIAQLRSEMDEQNWETAQVKKVTEKVLAEGQSVERQ